MMDYRTHEFKLCTVCVDYIEHWKELGRPEWHCTACGNVFKPNKGRVR